MSEIMSVTEDTFAPEEDSAEKKMEKAQYEDDLGYRISWTKARMLFDEGKRDEAAEILLTLVTPLVNRDSRMTFYRKQQEEGMVLQEVMTELIEKMPSYHPYFLAVTDQMGKTKKIKRAVNKKLINEKQGAELLSYEEELNRDLTKAEEVMADIRKKYPSVVCEMQTGYQFTQTIMMHAFDRARCYVTGLSRADLSRRDDLEKGKTVAKKKKTVDNLITRTNGAVKVSLSEYDDKQDEDETRLNTPKCMQVSSAEDMFFAEEDARLSEEKDEIFSSCAKVLASQTLSSLHLSREEKKQVQAAMLIAELSEIGFEIPDAAYKNKLVKAAIRKGQLTVA